MAPICRFWQRGDCRYGDSCKFEHPGREKPFQSNGNRFAALQGNQNTSSYNQGRSQPNGRTTVAKLPYSLSKEAIVADLSTERPQWILSAYGPGIRAPAQLFGGPLREQSFEEMRLHHYMGAASGNPAQAIQEAETLVQNAELQMRNALQDVDGAIQFILNAEKEHPNRIDICNAATADGAQAGDFRAPASAEIPATNHFATNKGPSHSSNPFAQPISSGAAPNRFGQAGQMAGTGAAGAFGRPSTLGQRSNPFAATPSSGNSGSTGGDFSSFAAASNPFGAPAQPSNAISFGAPAPPATTTNPFGAPPQTTSSNPFGASPQPAVSNPFGASSQPAVSNPFGASSQPAVSIPFGASSQPAVSNPFGASSQPAVSNPFGSAPQLAPANPFGSTQQSAPLNPFGAPPQPAPTNPFAPAAQSSVPNPFSAAPPQAQPNPFSPPQQPQASPFGIVPTNPSSTPNAFTQPPSNLSNPFGQAPAHPTITGNGPALLGQGSAHVEGRHPPLQSYTSRDANQRITMFKGQPVMYKDGEPGMRNRDGSWEKIWFPDGPPPHDKYTEAEDELYDDAIKSAYMHVRQTGSFPDGIMPLVPPRREWCLWDF
ncbi:MAG: hypothetical protein M1818_003090 [Claussenomyces sp. TS43310]|nr:MAG: hypothetical protein M1818_003090 [Claussenomyces sp. TS43310]